MSSKHAEKKCYSDTAIRTTRGSIVCKNYTHTTQSPALLIASKSEAPADQQAVLGARGRGTRVDEHFCGLRSSRRAPIIGLQRAFDSPWLQRRVGSTFRSRTSRIGVGGPPGRRGWDIILHRGSRRPRSPGRVHGGSGQTRPARLQDCLRQLSWQRARGGGCTSARRPRVPAGMAASSAQRSRLVPRDARDDAEAGDRLTQARRLHRGVRFPASAQRLAGRAPAIRRLGRDAQPDSPRRCGRAGRARAHRIHRRQGRPAPRPYGTKSVGACGRHLRQLALPHRQLLRDALLPADRADSRQCRTASRRLRVSGRPRRSPRG